MYLRHRGRPTRAQLRAVADLGPQLIVGDRGGKLDWDREFGRRAPLGLEIGFGMGHALLDWAAQRPDWNLIGVEVYQPGIGALLLGVERLSLHNVRLLVEDARSVLESCFQPASLDEVRIFFPDPWPKKRHHKRRLIQPDFIARIAACMRADATLMLATDWQHYAESMLAVLDREPLLTNLAGAGCFASRPASRPATRFEERGRKLGHAVWDLAYVRNR